MTHPTYVRDKAREMRVVKSLTIDEIAERLALPRTTIFHWVRDLPRGGVRERQRQRTGGQALATLAMQRKYRLLREEAYVQGVATFDRLAEDPTFRDFVCLYIAEGYKRTRSTVSICNSDPAVIKMSDGWIRRFTPSRVSYSVQYHADQDLEQLTEFWSSLLDVSTAAIRVKRKSNSNQLAGRTWRSEHGVLAVSTYNTLFRARLQAWMDLLRAEWH